MEKETKAADAQSQSKAEASSETQSQSKTYSEDAFKEVVAQRDEIKRKLRALEEDKERIIKDKEAEELKRKGDYESLMQKVNAEREQEKNALKNLITQSYLTALGADYGIAKPEYTKLLDVSVELDGLEIANADAVKKAFEGFKKDNPSLFTAKENKPVPKTDGVTKKPDNNQKLDPHTQLMDAVAQHLGKWNTNKK